MQTAKERIMGRCTSNWVAVHACCSAMLGCGHAATNEEPIGTSQAAITTSVTYTFQLPAALTTDQVAIVANGSLQIDDRAKIMGAVGAHAPVTNTGTSQTTLGVEAETGDVYSKPAVALSDRAKVFGSILSGGSITLGNSTTVTGSRSANTAVPFSLPITLTETFLDCSIDVNLEPDQQRSVVPDSYGHLVVKSRSSVQLSTGRYFFSDIDIEPQAQIVLDDVDGPVYLFVRSNVIYRGNIVSLTGQAPNVLVAYAGTNPVVLEAPFLGAFLAPNALLTLATVGAPGHTGQFYAQNLEVRPDNVVSLQAFGSWNRVPSDNPPPAVALPATAGTAPPLAGGTGTASSKVQAFLEWFARSTPGDTLAAAGAINNAHGDDAIAQALIDQAEAARSQHMDRTLAILSILGQLRHPLGLDYFRALVASPPPTGGTLDAITGVTFEEESFRSLQMKAVHGIGAMGPTAWTDLLLIARDHESRDVRSEAIRTFLFYNPKSGRSQLLSVVHVQDRAFVNRLEHRSFGAASYNQRLASYLASHPEKVPPPIPTGHDRQTPGCDNGRNL